MCGVVVDLHDRGISRQEFAVREVRPQQEEQVALGEALIRAAPTEQTRHSHGIGVVRLEDVLSAIRVADGSVHQLRKLKNLGPRIATTLAAEDHRAAGRCDTLSQVVEVGIHRPDLRPGLRQRAAAGRMVDLHDADVSGQDDHPDTTLQDRCLQGEFGQPRHLSRRGDVAHVSCAVGEDELGPGLLEVLRPDLPARDVGDDGEDRCSVAIAVIQPVEKMQAAGARRAKDRDWDAP